MENFDEMDDKFTSFVDEVTDSLKVYALKLDDEYAYTTSTEFISEEEDLSDEEEENEDDKSIDVICFWSSEAKAKVCQVDEWGEYQIEEIPLNDFLEDWCVGMYNDVMLAGLNFDDDMEGYESEILYLMNEIVKALEEKSVKLKFKKFNGIVDLKEHIDEVLDLE